MNNNEFRRDEDFDDFDLTCMIRAMNDFFLNGIVGVLKYIWNIVKKIPHWVKEFFIKGLPWLYRKIKSCIKYIFSGGFV